mmetsp:Transcript_39086/g.101018  ORF Transcript_39086/g.101018 Transcript_39086/m.101018 type:complete len:222 (-) Transcript_39086:71-736(-)
MVLDDVPGEVVRCLVFMILYFDSVPAAFGFCDQNKDGKLNHKEFVQRLSTTGCLLGPIVKPEEVMRSPLGEAAAQEKQTELLTSVYRFLDSSNNGEISRREFNLLQAIWSELHQSMVEFRNHVVDCFGSLDEGWEFADANGDGHLEWSEFDALAGVYHFDGPVRQIFLYLDKDEDEKIRHADWMVIDDVLNDPARRGVGTPSSSPRMASRDERRSSRQTSL